ncbi:hypothetical protein EHQ58_04635 [Leptospira ognonensis]|uniref:Uncharacterized protein n=1 Tax=Leptospira ognonensis TaxID=2484945 RepID=A0A4R9K6J9_9LEPT|nr:hypothetical protein [Leptospira ognonensis]TGL61898.1 hypothetical protein EHQ58_04635 [Leptospira ognonensis]
MQLLRTYNILFFFCVLFAVNIESKEEEISKPLLRVWPAFRPEECEDWAIMPFICKRCLWEGKQYAQRIFFFESGPYREHGCYLEPEGFISISERK